MPELISAASQAALNAVDKFVPKYENGRPQYTSVILSSIIARIQAIVTQEVKKQQIHFYPKDRKNLIEVSRMKKAGMTDPEIAEKLKISEGEVYSLCNGLFPVHFDTQDRVHQAKIKTSETHEDEMIGKQSMSLLKQAIEKLPLIDQKILRLKGFKS